MSKNYKKICLALALTGAIGAGTVTAKSGNQSVTATYRNIQVTYNGVTQPMSNEPFLVNGSVYVPLAAVGNIFGATPNWIPTSNTVALTGGNVSSSVDQTQLTQLNQQIQSLTAQLASKNIELNEVKAELAKYTSSNNSTSNSNGSFTTTSGTNITAAQLRETENYLNNQFSDCLKNINMNYSLTLYGNQIQVEMTYNTRQENNTFKKLSQYNVQAFMKKIGDNIAATHSDINIEGRILYGSEEKASFTRSRNANYNYQYSFDKEMIEDMLNDEIDYFIFRNIENKDTFKGSLKITGYEANIRPNSSKINVTVSLESNSDFKTLWEDKEKFDHDYAVKEQLSDIYDLVYEVANDYEVNIFVEHDKKTIAKMDSNEKVSTYTS